MRNIFVVGTGRSGTHLLCRTLCSFAGATDLMGGVEDPRTLGPTARAAIAGLPLPDSVSTTIVKKSHEANDKGCIYVDQTHPLLWFVESLTEIAPNSVFIFPWRPNEQILASMLKHRGVLEWYKRLHLGSIAAEYPSRFFGIQSKDELGSLSLERLCLARVVSHKREFLRLRSILGESKCRVLMYEELVVRGASAVTDLLTVEEVKTLGEQTMDYKADMSSLTKYVTELSREQKELAYSLEVGLR